MRPTIILIPKDPGLDEMLNVTKEQIQKLMEDFYNAGLEEGRNKALAEEYVKMTQLQKNIAYVEEKE